MTLPKTTIKKLCSEVKKGNIEQIIPFTKGHINQLYEVKYKTTSLMLRIFNESWKAKKEAYVYKLIKEKTNVPVPKIYTLDDSQKKVPFAYTIMSKIPGKEILEEYKTEKNAILFQKAGEALGKIHTIRFKKFGWIMDNEVVPSFATWKEFALYDIKKKIYALSSLSQVKKLQPMINKKAKNYLELLEKVKTPVLLHKDYYSSHILTEKRSVKGIIDVEWATAGHSENDFIKMELWVFKKFPEVREKFFKGYQKHQKISKLYDERKEFYILWHWINMVNISFLTNHKQLLKHNISRLKTCLR